MNTPARRSALRLTTAALLTAAALGACAENSNSDNRGFSMDGRWPNWSNNGTSETRSTTLGPGGGSADSAYEYCDESGKYHSMNSAEWNAPRDTSNRDYRR